jgi:hypothetical protein
MTRIPEHPHRLRAELVEVERLLANAPASDVLGRIGLEHRARELRAELEERAQSPSMIEAAASGVDSSQIALMKSVLDRIAAAPSQEEAAPYLSAAERLYQRALEIEHQRRELYLSALQQRYQTEERAAVRSFLRRTLATEAILAVGLVGGGLAVGLSGVPAAAAFLAGAGGALLWLFGRHLGELRRTSDAH